MKRAMIESGKGRAPSRTVVAPVAALVCCLAFAHPVLADGETSEEAPATPATGTPAEASARPLGKEAAAPPVGRAQPTLPTIELLVGGVPLVVEIASGGEQRYMGLSFRETLDEDAGMLFVYPAERPLTFTMRNTLLPLSIAFIGDDLVVREIVDMDVGPGQLFDSAQPARYALEVNQGWFERNGVGPGAPVAMP